MADSPGAGRLLLHVDPDLALFLDARWRRDAGKGGAATTAAGRLTVEAFTDGDATVGHVVQTAGIPLTEVGAVRGAEGGVGVLARARPGSLLRIDAVSRPQPAPTDPARFILDVHLGRLARHLRVLGVDTAYDSTADDDTLVMRAATQRRILLTQDRGLLKRRRLPGRSGVNAASSSAGSATDPPWTAGYVRGSRAGDQLTDVLTRWAPDLAAWTRCPTCNGGLSAVAKDQVLTLLQPGTRRQFDEFARCQRCGGVFWHGAHAARLDALVKGAEQTVRAVRSGPPSAR